MNSTPPNGFFAEGLMIFGPLEKGGFASKGFVLQPPDLRGASVAHLNAYQDKVRALLAQLNEGMRAQFQWLGNSDYVAELTAFGRAAEKVAHPRIKRALLRRWEFLWKKMHARELRREHLVLFLSVPIAALPVHALTREGLSLYYVKILAQLRAQFEEITGTLRTIFGADTTVTPMDDLAHFTYCAKFLNPSFAERFDLDFAAQFNPALSIQENCWLGEGRPGDGRNGPFQDGDARPGADAGDGPRQHARDGPLAHGGDEPWRPADAGNEPRQHARHGSLGDGRDEPWRDGHGRRACR